MSGLLAGKVWLSNLSSELKPLAATLADIADDDGSSIWPSVDYVAWRLGVARRTVQRDLSELRSMGVLTVIVQGGGYGRTTEYKMEEEALPKRPSWAETRNQENSANLSPLSEEQRQIQQTIAPNTANYRDTAMTHDPSLPVREPSLESKAKDFESELQNQECQKCGSVDPTHHCPGQLSKKQREKNRIKSSGQRKPFPTRRPFDTERPPRQDRAYPPRQQARPVEPEDDDDEFPKATPLG